jgi:hypothetical protein
MIFIFPDYDYSEMLKVFGWVATNKIEKRDNVKWLN